MSETTFTPGPWRRAGSARNPTGRIWAPDGRGNVEVAQVGNYGDSELLRFNKDRWDADAHLISAAPELYEALREIIRCSEIGGTPGEVWEAGYAALARAEGKP
jgi:hypothetical protein